jgi:g-D-glutamyl-meso-diaminopimelate peptidase
VDLNLQYPAGWDIARRIKFDQGYTRPGPRNYVGSEPLITPENRAVAKWTQEHEFALTLSYHTQGRTIYWSYDDEAVAEARTIGAAMSRSSGYALEAAPYNSAHAGYTDWFIHKWHRPGFTIEAGIGTNPLSLSQFEEIYRENLPILVQGIALSP